MANFGDYNSMSEGAMFIFGSWVCIVDGVGGFCRHFTPTTEKKASAPTTRCIIDELIEDFGVILLSNLIRGYEYQSGSQPTSTCAQIGLLESDSNPSSTHPTQFPIILRNSVTVYQKAAQSKLQSALEEDLEQQLRLREEPATTCQEANTFLG